MGQNIQATVHVGGLSHNHWQRHINSADGGGFESNHVSDTGAGTVRQNDWQAYTATQRRGQLLKGIIKNHWEVAPTDANWRALSDEHK